MALAKTTPLELGFKAPDFSLIDVVTGQKMSFKDVRGVKGTLVMFICNHCPYVIHVRGQLIQLALHYQAKGIGFVGISANDVEQYPQDGPEQMRALAEELGFPFPYLYDETQEVAWRYHAVCTPDFSLFDDKDSCVYRGRLDAATPGNDQPVNGADMRKAIDAVLDGTPIDWDQLPSMGCSIKWKPENE